MGTKSKCQTVGYAYFMSFTYVFAEHTTSLHGVYLDGNAVYGRNVVEKVSRKLWNGKEVEQEVVTNNPPVTTNTTLHFKTGKQNDTVPSHSPDGTVHYVQGGDYPMPKMQQWTGQPIKYKNLSALVFDDCFIGDGVRNLPQYSCLLANGYYHKVSGNTDDTRANPVDIIYDILKRDLKMSDNDIAIDTFENAAATLDADGIYVGFAMTSEKKVSFWFDELLKIMDGALYYDPITNKLSLKLLRMDYNPDEITVLDDTMVSKMTLDAPSWQDTYNKFTFKFTDPFKDDVASVEYSNTASRLSLGYDRPKTIQLTPINSMGVLSVVANRMVAKLGIPNMAVKLQVDFIDFPNLHIGAVFKLNSDKLGVYGKIFRVMKITGDAEDKAYVNITAVEDFYARGFNFDIVEDIGDDYVPPVYTIDTTPQYFKAIDSSREFSEEDEMIWMAGKPADTDYITAINVNCVNGGDSTGQPSLVGKLLEVIPEDISSTDEPCPYYNQTYTFVIEDLIGGMYEIIGSSISLQTLKHTLVVGNEIMVFKSLNSIGNNRYQVEGIMRGVGGTEIVQHNVDDIVYINGVLHRNTATVRVPNGTPTLQAYAYNHQDVGPKVTIYPTYNHTIKKPYKPVPYIKDGKIVWRPRVARKGATYKNADNMTAGEDEGIVTGYYVVQEPNGNEVTITPQNGDILIEFVPTQTGTHKVKHVNSENHYTDGWVNITV